MGQSGNCFSQPQQKSQMRVSVTGMVQAALFLPSSLWTVAIAFLYITDLVEKVDPNRFVTMTFCSMSSLGNLLCFGFSQSVFRNGIGHQGLESKPASQATDREPPQRMAKKRIREQLEGCGRTCCRTFEEKLTSHHP
ncbi:hypothetical protein Q8A67_006863 [Cirrhinus molitorella]|uniref:Uncharacterized protein n=1 Tax=Cirrhinus molitorella TaxID=172907 RepID=A0AA88TR72_9TELE|nr:hypothetical protein Q8A67_006863 [Cirrhinus molitorella]